jgi:hypothetical protein
MEYLVQWRNVGRLNVEQLNVEQLNVERLNVELQPNVELRLNVELFECQTEIELTTPNLT